jgi:hypothetical protein
VIEFGEPGSDRLHDHKAVTGPPACV